MKVNKKKTTILRSIKIRIALALFALVFIQGLILFCSLLINGILSKETMVSSILISVIGIAIPVLALFLFVTSYLSVPILRLCEKVKKIDPRKPVRFEKTNILVIDELSHAFEVLSDGISEAAAGMFNIVELVDLPLGSFEICHTEETVHLSKSLFGLLNLTPPGDGSFTIPLSVWLTLMGSLEQDYFIENEDGITETLYMTNNTWNNKQWFRMRQITKNLRDIGVIIDVTDEITQKQRLEFERNHDPLTKLLNRQAFMNQAQELLKSQTDKIGIMMFADLDDLKFVNDTYGHESGDSYIKAFAGLLNKFNKMGAVVGRISGDEFVMFMSGFSSQEEVKASFDHTIKGLDHLFITTPNGKPHRLRVSIGLSYFPQDSEDINELVKFADYAMYEIKHSVKGEIKEFDLLDYNKNSFIIEMKDILNLLIDEHRINFAFQPIVDVSTGEVFGYEALMRPLLRELKSADAVLKVARSQAKLYQIERLTFFTVFDWMHKNQEIIDNKKIFINSIPGQILLENDLNEMLNKFTHLSNQIIFEITENEFSSMEDTEKKIKMFRDFGSMIAIDDYGSGYSNDLALLLTEPNFLKIDMSIVRDIDKDMEKQQLVQNAIAYSARKNIKIVAEGVETYEEMCKVIDLGVHYIQGYYFAKPSLTVTDIPEELKNILTAPPANQ